MEPLLEFIIPDHKEQLLDSTGDHRIFVEGVFPFADLSSDEQKQFISELYNKIIAVMEDLIPPILSERENLGKLYSAIDSIKIVNSSVKRELSNLLADGIF